MPRTHVSVARDRSEHRTVRQDIPILWVLLSASKHVGIFSCFNLARERQRHPHFSMLVSLLLSPMM